MRFQIGQTAWIATFEAREASIECPDCAGTGRLRVMFADDSIVSIDCANCGPGYNPPTGRVRVYDRSPGAKYTTITGVEVRDKTEWRTADHYCVADEDIFDNQADALARATEKAAEHDCADRERAGQKEKNGKSWGWHAIYHRREIKRAKEQIEYHTKKLAVANLKAKEVKAIVAGSVLNIHERAP